MNTYLCVLAFFAISLISCSSLDAEDLSKIEWQQFKSTYGKKYDNIETELFRHRIFLENKRKIDEHNKFADAGLKSNRLRMNQFGDLLNEEFSRMMGFRAPLSMKRSIPKVESVQEIVLPKEIDYRKKGYVTPVKDQGECGSCWAFSATGALEGQVFATTGKLVPLSEQELVDCSYETGNTGCDGGLMDKAFVYARLYGLSTSKSYPYKGEEGICQRYFRNLTIGAKGKGYYGIKEGSEAELANILYAHGPVSVAINVTNEFRFHGTGILNDLTCPNGPSDLGHALLVVGFGENSKGEQYWIVKNSWGRNWGDHGYILMSRNKNNQCGIATLASIPLVE